MAAVGCNFPDPTFMLVNSSSFKLCRFFLHRTRLGSAMADHNKAYRHLSWKGSVPLRDTVLSAWHLHPHAPSLLPVSSSHSQLALLSCVQNSRVRGNKFGPRCVLSAPLSGTVCLTVRAPFRHFKIGGNLICQAGVWRSSCGTSHIWVWPMICTAQLHFPSERICVTKYNRSKTPNRLLQTGLFIWLKARTSVQWEPSKR